MAAPLEDEASADRKLSRQRRAGTHRADAPDIGRCARRPVLRRGHRVFQPGGVQVLRQGPGRQRAGLRARGIRVHSGAQRSAPQGRAAEGADRRGRDDCILGRGCRPSCGHRCRRCQGGGDGIQLPRGAPINRAARRDRGQSDHRCDDACESSQASRMPGAASQGRNEVLYPRPGAQCRAPLDPVLGSHDTRCHREGVPPALARPAHGAVPRPAALGPRLCAHDRAGPEQQVGSGQA